MNELISPADVIARADQNPNWRHPTNSQAATNTRWGPAQHVAKYGPGVRLYSCAGHGGFKLRSTRNDRVHQAWRDPEGWYEQDCEYAIVVFHFPEMFSHEMVETAVETLRRWLPAEFEEVTGQTGTPQVDPGN